MPLLRRAPGWRGRDLGLNNCGGSRRAGRRRFRVESWRTSTLMHHARYGAALAILAVAAASVVVGLTAGGAGAAGLVFSDGFESGNLTQWTASSGVTVQNSVKYAGSWAARATT